MWEICINIPKSHFMNFMNQEKCTKKLNKLYGINKYSLFSVYFYRTHNISTNYHLHQLFKKEISNTNNNDNDNNLSQLGRDNLVKL